jgi:uncharacterized oxidoreductase
MQISNNIILITGGATGIGLALAEQFLQNNNEVIICGRREDLLQNAKTKFPKLHIKQADLSTSKDRKEFANWLTNNYPNLNILVNNAGIKREFSFLDTTVAEKFDNENEIETNLIAPIHLTMLLLPELLKKDSSAVINISSGLGFVPISIMPIYCATKSAIQSFSISLRHQLKETKLKVFDIAPPIVDTDLDKGARAKRGQTGKGISAITVADETLKAMQNNKFEIGVGKVKILKVASKIAPKLFLKIMNKTANKN